MSLAAAGRLITRRDGPGGLPFGVVAFGQVVRDVCLTCTPHARIGDYVLVDVGMALEVLDEPAARAVIERQRRWAESGVVASGDALAPSLPRGAR